MAGGEVWKILSHFSRFCIGTPNSFICVEGEKLVSEYSIANKAADCLHGNHLLFTFHFDVPEVPGVKKYQGDPNSHRLCTIQSSSGQYVANDPNSGSIDLVDADIASPYIYFYAVIHQIEHGIIRVQSAVNFRFISIHAPTRNLYCQDDEKESYSFLFMVKCSIQSSTSQNFLAAAKENLTARSLVLENPLQIFLICIAPYCTVLSPFQQSMLCIKDERVSHFKPQKKAGMVPVREEIALRLKMLPESDRNVFRLHTHDNKFLCTSDDGYINIETSQRASTCFSIQIQPKKAPQPSQPIISIIDLPLDKKEERIHHQSILEPYQVTNSGEIRSNIFTTPLRSSGSGKPSFYVVRSNANQKIEKLFHLISSQLKEEGGNGQILIFCRDSFFADKISQKLREIGSTSYILSKNTHHQRIEEIRKAVELGEVRFLIVTAQCDITLLTSNMNSSYFEHIIYFDISTRYKEVELWSSPRVFFQICTPHEDVGALYKYLKTTSIQIDPEVTQSLSIQREMKKAIFNVELTEPIVTQFIQGFLLHYLLICIPQFRLRSHFLFTDVDCFSLRCRLERGESLALLTNGNDFPVVFQLLLYFLKLIPGKAIPSEACKTLSSVTSTIQACPNGYYALQRAIRILPKLHYLLIDHIFSYLHLVFVASLANSLDIAREIEPFLLATNSPVSVYALEVNIRCYKQIKNSSPYDKHPKCVLLHPTFVPTRLQPSAEVSRVLAAPSIPSAQNWVHLPPNTAQPPTSLFSPLTNASPQPMNPHVPTAAALAGFFPPHQQALPVHHHVGYQQQGQCATPSPYQQQTPLQRTTFTIPHSPARVREDWELDVSEIKLEKKIGSGSFGDVWKGEWAGSVVAVKKVNGSSIGPKELAAFREEINIMTKLRHPNILQFLGACLEPDLLLVTEFADRSSLFHVLQGSELSWDRSKKIVSDIARGMMYLHTRNPPIVHRDIKSLNILVTKDWKGLVADFGLTKIKSDAFLQTYCGSPAWTAPEVLKGYQYDESADVFSFGVVLWEVLSRKPPYQGMQPNIIIGKIISQPSFRPPIPPGSPISYVQLMTRCWDENPRARPSFTQIVEELKIVLA